MSSLDVPPDVERGKALALTYIFGCAVSLIFVAMRLFPRFSIAGVGFDDWCMLATWVIFVPFTVIISLLSFAGGTRHLHYLMQESPEHTVYVVKLNWVAQPLAILCLGLGKVAVATLIVRLLNRDSFWRRWALHVASGWTVINTIIMITLTFAQCKDPKALWDPTVAEHTSCWDPRVQSSVSMYGAAFHAALDFFLALVPVTLVKGLKTDLRKRIGLSLLMGCGVITGICASIKTSTLSKLNQRSDFTWETFSIFLWTGIEIILLMICGSIPALKPCYGVCMGARVRTTTSATYRSQRKSSHLGHARSESRTPLSGQRDVSDASDDMNVSYPLAVVVAPDRRPEEGDIGVVLSDEKRMRPSEEFDFGFEVHHPQR